MALLYPAHSHPSPSYLSPGTDGWPHSLETARRVQQHLVPQELPRPAGWNVAAAWRPAQVVAGDYLDVFGLGADHLALALGDVAGKGLGPALVMAGLRAVVRSRLPYRTGDLAGLMGELNDYLIASTPDDLFVTLFLGVLDASTGQLRYVNAGHLPPLVVAGPPADEVRRLTEGGTVLGVSPGADFEEGQVELKPGSHLALFSDGITEAANRAGRMFHERRIVEALQDPLDESSARTVARLLEGLERFTEGKEQEDDVSLILLQRLG